jgi:hypothetical protein
MTRGVRVAAVTGTLLLTVAACDGGDARGTKPLPPLSPSAASATVSPTPTPSPTRSKPADPKAEVDAFVHEYFEAVNDASRTGNTTAWRSLMTDDCVCQELAQSIEDSWAAGSISGLKWIVQDVFVQGVSRSDAQLLVTYDVSEHDDLDRDGNVRDHYPESRNAKDALTLQASRGRWRVAHRVLIRRGTTD